MDKLLSKCPLDSAIGAAWLAERYDVEPVQPFRVISRIGSSRGSTRVGNRWDRVYGERYRPESTFRAHFEFMLRYEVLNLEFLARLFRLLDPKELEAWVHSEPTGRYARRAGFLYEWLTGERLDFEGVKNGAYVNILDPNEYFVATDPQNITRWHVKNNLPGDQTFCPIVYLSDTLKEALSFDVAGAWSGLEVDFGAELIERSSVWLTVKESRSSFAIEGEGKQADRIRRFAMALETELGRHENVFGLDSLSTLQRAILGENSTRYGVRQSPIFIGESRGAFEIVHYIAPHWDLSEQMLYGLARCETLTRGQSSVMRAAVISFGFVYAHPLSDGNGRLSRFLINDILRRDGVLPETFVLPVSAVISGSMREYDRTLEILSKPLMKRYRGAYRFAENVRYADGLTSTLHFDAYADAEPAWRYPDLTEHVDYLCRVVRDTIEVELRQEAEQMRAYRTARYAVNDVIEGPDEDLDRIVRSVRENKWQISGKILSEFPLLRDEVISSRIISSVRRAFESVVSSAEQKLD